MQDEKHQNLGTMTGTPTLVAGGTTDGDQGLQFDGSTNKMTVVDSPSDSLAVADGAAGGMALVCFVKFASFPASTKYIAFKNASYYLKIRADGKLEFTLENGANNVTVVGNQVLQLGQWYHVACVYNGDYTGTPQFGYSTQGASQFAIPGDYFHGSPTSGTTYNLHVSKFTCPERGALTGVVMDLQRVFDTTDAEFVRAVVYKDAGGVPGELVAQSADQRLGVNASGAGGGPATERLWITFPLSGALFAGDYWLGFEGGESNGAFQCGGETTGGSRKYRRDDRGQSNSYPVSASVDPFGAAGGSDAVKLSVYATYTPTGRTGAEGKALIYVNKQLDNSAAYAHGIADSANDLIFAPSDGSGCPVQIDEPAIFNRKLTPVEVAYLYSAR